MIEEEIIHGPRELNTAELLDYSLDFALSNAVHSISMSAPRGKFFTARQLVFS